MRTQTTDITIVGGGPVGLMCAHLAKICGLHSIVVDRDEGPLEVGRADALNARTLQLLEVAGLFDELYPLGKKCNTSSVWANGQFISRQSSWWDEIEGCFHKHFLMLGQSFVEKILDHKLKTAGVEIKRSTSVQGIHLVEGGCQVLLSSGESIQSKYVIGADGSQSFVRQRFNIPFDIQRPELLWAVIDGVVETDFPKVPEIIAFQNDTSDVAWIPREGEIDRFYVRMDKKHFTMEEVMAKINRALRPHTLSFKEVVWSSQFSVKESVAQKFFVEDRVFLAGDACHIHSVNGGQGLNTGLGDTFNLIWKLHMVMNFGARSDLLQSYESERRPVALSVVETSGELVRSTKHSKHGTHAEDYVKIVARRAGNITGMGIGYDLEGARGPCGQRLFDLGLFHGKQKTRLYSLLDYARFTLVIFGESEKVAHVPSFVKVLQVGLGERGVGYWAEELPYGDQALLVRPDAYIEASGSLSDVELVIGGLGFWE